MDKVQLRDARFIDEFLNEHVFFLGDAEFEDVFSDELITDCLNAQWPKAEGVWKIEDIQALRGKRKFSDEICKIVYEHHTQPDGNQWRKPDFGKVMAERCPAKDIPKPIMSFFKKARKIACVE